jgi:hypothetical protein
MTGLWVVLGSLRDGQGQLKVSSLRGFAGLRVRFGRMTRFASIALDERGWLSGGHSDVQPGGEDESSS